MLVSGRVACPRSFLSKSLTGAGKPPFRPRLRIVLSDLQALRVVHHGHNHAYASRITNHIQLTFQTEESSNVKRDRSRTGGDRATYPTSPRNTAFRQTVKQFVQTEIVRTPKNGTKPASFQRTFQESGRPRTVRHPSRSKYGGNDWIVVHGGLSRRLLVLEQWRCVDGDVRSVGHHVAVLDELERRAEGRVPETGHRSDRIAALG